MQFNYKVHNSFEFLTIDLLFYFFTVCRMPYSNVKTGLQHSLINRYFNQLEYNQQIYWWRSSVESSIVTDAKGIGFEMGKK